jgi:glucose/arabinose dehydrogenase
MTIERALKRMITLSCVLLGVLASSCGEERGGEPSEDLGRIREAATVPAGFADEVVASGIASPTAMAFAPDGRLFVCQQGGQLRVIKNGALLATPFLSVTVNSSGERGLLGVAFDPSFATNGFVYVYYTATGPTIHNRVSRFTANGDVAVPGSETVLMDLETLSATNHNGGAIHFGPDGKLYVAVGENAVGNNAQILTNRLGKMLRVNADGTIPSDNPFFSSATGDNRSIWALGLRNPFTFAFQPGTGRMFINDVGQATWEEINDGIAAANYGWPITEGATSDPRFRAPIHAYSSASGAECAITGGAFYNPSTPQFPASYVGKYFFADYCGNWIRVFDPATSSVQNFASALSSPVDLHVGADGLLYYLMRGNTGLVGRIRSTASQAPSITTHPASQSVPAGQAVTFSVNATGTQPLAYQWQRGTTNITGATSSSYTFTAQATDNGATFRVIVSNAFGSVTSNAATLNVSVNTAPTATITTPIAGTLYSAGGTVNFAGTGTDPQDGTLPASAFTWEVVFHHDTHTHPFLPATSGATSGSFIVPNTGETATDVFYRIHLTVRDSSGFTHSTFRDVLPNVSTLTLQSSPTGLSLTLDGTPLTAPTSFSSVVGMRRTLGVISPQNLGSRTYSFRRWSDGGAATHVITTPAVNTTYTATFRRVR